MTTRKQIEDLFASSDARAEHVFELNKSPRLRKEYEDNIYKHPFYACIIDRGKNEPIRWACALHTMTHNIHFDTIIHHICFHEPEKHKEFIIDNTHFS